MKTSVSSTTVLPATIDKSAIKTTTKPPLAQLVCTDASLDGNLEGLKVELEETELTLGRAITNTVTIDSMRVSRQHVRIYPKNGHWLIEDLCSTNGVLVNTTKTREASLNHGDQISIASIQFRFELEHDNVELEHNTEPALTPRPTPKQLNQNPEATIVMQSSPFFTGDPTDAPQNQSPQYGWYVAFTLILLLTGAVLTAIFA
jgi:hypothetical protein